MFKSYGYNPKGPPRDYSKVLNILLRLLIVVSGVVLPYYAGKFTDHYLAFDASDEPKFVYWLIGVMVLILVGAVSVIAYLIIDWIIND